MFAGQGLKTKAREKHISTMIGKISLDFLGIYAEFLSVKDNPIRTEIFELYEQKLDRIFPKSKYLNRITRTTGRSLLVLGKIAFQKAIRHLT